MAAQWRCHGQLHALHARVWEEHSVRLCCATWNANGKVQPQAAVREWLRGAEDLWGEAGAEIYVVGLQEAVELDAMNLMADAGSLVRAAGPGDGAYVDAKGRTTALGAWRARVEAALQDVGGGLELVAARQLVGIMLFVLAAPHIRPLIADVEADSVRTGLGGMAGNKGAIGVRMTVGLSTVCFVCAHLAAHKKNTAERNSNYHAIINGLAFGEGAGAGGAAGDPGDLPRRARAALSGEGAVPSAHVLRQDDVVVFGDLNYRLDGAADAAAVAQMVAEGRIEELRASDQLERERRAGRAFWGFSEGPLAFAPTYKFVPDSDEYSGGGKGRVPAWTDRVLWSGAGHGGLSLLAYRACMQVRGSDHKPVVALFDLCIKQGVRSPSLVESLVRGLESPPGQAGASSDTQEHHAV